MQNCKISEGTHPFYREVVKRRYARKATRGFTCDITDGSLAYTGTIEDISVGGFRLANVPVTFNGKQHKYTIIISGEKGHFRMVAKPCWARREELGHHLDVGFKILDAPLAWFSYVMSTAAQGEFENIGHAENMPMQ